MRSTNVRFDMSYAVSRIVYVPSLNVVVSNVPSTPPETGLAPLWIVTQEDGEDPEPYSRTYCEKVEPWATPETTAGVFRCELLTGYLILHCRTSGKASAPAASILP